MLYIEKGENAVMTKEVNLEPIIEYQMSPIEALAYKIALSWQILAKKAFPEKTIITLKKTGDPRKCYLFKCCLRLVKETKGLLPYSDYSLYVKAQIDILKAFESEENYIDINPLCLSGDKSWVRWKIWKKKYDAISKRTCKEDASINKVEKEEVIKDLEKTRKFLVSRFGDNYNENDIKENISSLERWLVLGKLSPYYAILSPWMNKYCDKVNIDLNLYKQNLNEEISLEFNKIFNEI